MRELFMTNILDSEMTRINSTWQRPRFIDTYDKRTIPSRWTKAVNFNMTILNKMRLWLVMHRCLQDHVEPCNLEVDYMINILYLNAYE